jgi:hypothetical protein
MRVVMTMLATLLAAGSLGGTAQAASTPAACTLGSLSARDANTVRTVLSTARTRFERTLTGVSSARAKAAGAAYTTDLAAWLYGFPTVIVRRTINTFPRNTMVSIAKLADTTTQTVVAPNHDTLYSVGQIDLSAGPIVIETPPTGGRYSVIQLTDSFTNVATYIGDGAAARTGAKVVLVPRGWHGSLPAGLRVVRPATNLLWLLGRTLATGTADQAAAAGLLAKYSVTTLAGYLAGTRGAPLILKSFPARKPVTVPTDATFFDELGADLAADPAPARDACAISAFAEVGIGAGRTPSKTLTGLRAKALTAAARDGRRVLNTLVGDVRHEPGRSTNGWTTTPRDTARFGTDYLSREVVAAIGLGANTVEKAIYLSINRDSVRRPLSGSHVYVVRFKKGQLPPVVQFWSLTLYDQRILFYPNPLGRYAIGDRTKGLKYDAGGGLTIVVSHNPPAASERSNWLPAPSGPFSLYLRLYEPKAAARDRLWKPPAVTRVR